MKGLNFSYKLDLSTYQGMDKYELLNELKEHDVDTFNSSFNVGAFNYALAKEMGFDLHKVRLFEGGLFHDIGKLGMEPDFINFPARYTDQMFDEMKFHPYGGFMLLQHIGCDDKFVRDAVSFHHKNFDGSGYGGSPYLNPEGKQIPLVARLTRVSDSIEAFLTNRCYKNGGSPLDAFDDLNQHSGSDYDPNVIEALEKVHDNVITSLGIMGNENPTREDYINTLIDNYLGEFHLKSPQDVVDFYLSKTAA